MTCPNCKKLKKLLRAFKIPTDQLVQLKTDYPLDFEAFWIKFIGRWDDNKGGYVKGSKAKALVEWKKLDISQRQMAVLSATSGSGEKYTLDGCRWLKWKGWEDIVIASSPKKEAPKCRCGKPSRITIDRKRYCGWDCYYEEGKTNG